MAKTTLTIQNRKDKPSDLKVPVMSAVYRHSLATSVSSVLGGQSKKTCKAAGTKREDHRQTNRERENLRN